MTFTGEAASLPLDEQAAIVAIASRAGVDPAALAAIRLAEHGRPGREFGVLSVQTGGDPSLPATNPGSTFWAQGTVAASSLAASLTRYRASTGNPYDAAGRLTDDFWRTFGARWAPLGASNDPTGLNANWFRNAWAAYESSYVT